MSKRIFITCALPYINADPHLGHMFEFIQGDCFARFNKIIGNEVHFTAGTDENSLKNIIAAKNNNVDIKDWIDQKTKSFVDLANNLDISFDDFIRTSSVKHHAGAKKLWSMIDKNDLEKRSYQGLYCVGCEAFYSEDELENGLCKEHHTKPELVTEQNHFFKLSKYKDVLIQKINSKEWNIMPEGRKNEVLGFLNGDVLDISVTRPKKRSEGIGIEIPDDNDQVLWVWIDALSNYINVVDFGEKNTDNFEKWWNQSDERWHFLGKGILRFHAVFWPAFLLSAKLKMPTHLFCHGYVNLNHQKMSKSLGNVINPSDLLSKYPVDSIRYYLMKDIPSDDDGNFDEENLIQRHNSELCSSFGNLISRTLSLIEKYEKPVTLKDFSFKKDVSDIIQKYSDNFKIVKINDAIANAFEVVALANKYISETKPWSIIESNPEQFEQIMANCLYLIIYSSLMLSPIMPRSTKTIFENLDIKISSFDDILLLNNKSFSLKKGDNLFERI